MADKIINNIVVDNETTKFYAPSVLTGLEETEAVSELKEDLNAESARAQAEESRIEALFTGDVSKAVNDWLDEHPEATTTVQDGTITYSKLIEEIQLKLVDITYVCGLSTSDASANTTLLNSLLAVKDVKLIKGIYPISGTIIIDSHKLDMNGSTFNVPEYETAEIIALKGENPCIMNGEICGSYIHGTTSSSLKGQSAILVYSVNNAIIKNMRIHNICGRGISHNLADMYGDLQGVSSAESIYTGVHTSAKFNIKSNYKYLRTIGGNGFNSVYTVSEVQYKFYNSSDELILDKFVIPSHPVIIPQDATTFTVGTQTGKSGLAEGFIPYNVGFTNDNCYELVQDCDIHDCCDWGIANLFGTSIVIGVNIYNQYTGSGLDVEDHQASRLYFINCHIQGTMAINSFYAFCYNCDFSYSPYYGKAHSLVNCTGSLYIRSDRDFYKTPSICIVGGDIQIGSDTYNVSNIDTFAKTSLLLTNGPIYHGYSSNQMNLFGKTNFIYRTQSLRKGEPAIVGIAVGTFIYRCVTKLNPLIWHTFKGSNVTIYADCEDISNQVATYLFETNNECYGLYGINCIVYPNGNTIYDSVFRPYGLQGNQGSVYGRFLQGKYVNCDFDAKEFNLIATSNNEAINLTFERCLFKNLNTNTLLLPKNGRAASTLTFKNCVFEDVSIASLTEVKQYITSDMTNITVIIDGTTYSE